MKRLLFAIPVFCIFGCSPVPMGEVARVSGVDDKGAYFNVIEGKIREAKAGNYEYVGALSTLVTRPVTGESLSCERYMRKSVGPQKGDYVRIDRRGRLNFHLDGEVIRFWIDDGDTGVECGGVSEGENLVVTILFSYQPSSLWSDGDELDSLEIPLIVRGAVGGM